MKRIVGLGIRHDVVRAESWKFHDAFRPKRKAGVSLVNALTRKVKFYFIWTVTRRNIKGRPFWSRVWVVASTPRKEHRL